MKNIIITSTNIHYELERIEAAIAVQLSDERKVGGMNENMVKIVKGPVSKSILGLTVGIVTGFRTHTGHGYGWSRVRVWV